MKITPKDTVSDVVMRNRALFSMGTERIVKAIQGLPEPEFVPMKRRMWFDKRLPVRDIADITMGELNAIEARKPSYEYFCIVLGVMLGLTKFNRIGVDGNPDWNAEFSIDEEQIGRLRFILFHCHTERVGRYRQIVGKAGNAPHGRRDESACQATQSRSCCRLPQILPDNERRRRYE